jgi:hypothetical protein
MFRWLAGTSVLAFACWLYFDRRARARHQAWLAERRHEDERVDEAIQESFPASDPPAHR